MGRCVYRCSNLATQVSCIELGVCTLIALYADEKELKWKERKTCIDLMLIVIIHVILHVLLLMPVLHPVGRAGK